MTVTFYLKQSPLAEFHNIYDHLHLFSLSPKTERGFHLTVISSAYKREHIKYGPKEFILLLREGLNYPRQYLYIWSVVWRLTREGEGAWQSSEYVRAHRLKEIKKVVVQKKT